MALAVTGAPAGIVACTPGVTYERVDIVHVTATTLDPSNPLARQIAFALQTSSVLVTAADRQRDDEKAKNPCQAEDCLKKATWTVGADRDNAHVYFAKLAPGTKLSVTPSDGDPLLPKAVSQRFTDPATVMIVKVGGLAAAGMTAGGPLMALGASLSGSKLLDLSKGDPMRGLACPGEKYGLPPTASIHLPRAIHRILPDAPWSPDPGKPASICWHAVSTEGEDANARWFFRVTDRVDPDGTVPPTLGDVRKPSLFVSSDSLSGAGKVDFGPPPRVERCCSKWCGGTTWSRGVKGDILTKELTVSDPAWVQTLDLTKDGRTITLRSGCGGIATSNAAVDQAGMVETILKGYNDYKAAEAKRN